MNARGFTGIFFVFIYVYQRTSAYYYKSNDES